MVYIRCMFAVFFGRVCRGLVGCWRGGEDWFWGEEELGGGEWRSRKLGEIERLEWGETYLWVEWWWD